MKCKIIVIRHGSRQGDGCPNDCIDGESFKEIKEFGETLRSDRDIVVEKIYMSPRGRAVVTAAAFGIGNAKGSLVPFETVSALRDVSNDNPAVASEAKKIAEAKKISTEEALILVTDPASVKYLTMRINELAEFLQDVSVRKADQTIAVCGHGGLLEPAIEALRRSSIGIGYAKLTDLQTKRYLRKGEALELAFQVDRGVSKLSEVRFDLLG